MRLRRLPMKTARAAEYIVEHTQWGAQLVASGGETAEQLVDECIRHECWGVTYYVQPAEQAAVRWYMRHFRPRWQNA
jgi:hypothetical protein